MKSVPVPAPPQITVPMLFAIGAGGNAPLMPTHHLCARSLLCALVLSVAACSSGASDDDRPADVGTVRPPDSVGVGGGVPVDNLQPDVADQERQTIDDVDGDGGPEG